MQGVTGRRRGKEGNNIIARRPTSCQSVKREEEKEGKSDNSLGTNRGSCDCLPDTAMEEVSGKLCRREKDRKRKLFRVIGMCYSRLGPWFAVVWLVWFHGQAWTSRMEHSMG